MLAHYIHHRIASSFSLLEDTSVAWYNHEPLPVIENDVIKVLWHFDIQTDKHVTSNRPDIIIVDKKEKSLKLMDVAIPNDMNIVWKGIEKIEKYANLMNELKELWSMKTVETIPVVTGCTGTVDKKFVDYVDKFPAQVSIGEVTENNNSGDMLHCEKIFKLLSLEHGLDFIITPCYSKNHPDRMSGKFN